MVEDPSTAKIGKNRVFAYMAIWEFFSFGKTVSLILIGGEF